MEKNLIEQERNVVEKLTYKNDIEKSKYVLKNIQNSLKTTSVGYISVDNIFDYIAFLENKLLNKK